MVAPIRFFLYPDRQNSSYRPPMQTLNNAKRQLDFGNDPMDQNKQDQRTQYNPLRPSNRIPFSIAGRRRSQYAEK